MISSISSNNNNKTLFTKRLDEFQRANQANGQLTLKQMKTLFLLNKHNGVLSSRRTINEMLPGVYVFSVRLRSNHYYSSVTLDSMRFKLIILPVNSLLDIGSKNVYNYFKFSREMYKFERGALLTNNDSISGQISLVQRGLLQSGGIAAVRKGQHVIAIVDG